MLLDQHKHKKNKKRTDAQNLWWLHWVMATCFLLLFISGNYMADLPKNVFYRQSFFNFHETLGVIVMSLLLARIVVLLRVIQKKYKRRLPKQTGEWTRTFIHHTALYFFMLLVPLSGYLLVNSVGRDVDFFGTGIILPHLFPASQVVGRLARSLHFWLAYTFLAAIALHLLAQWQYLLAQLRRFSKMAMGTILSGNSRLK